MYIPQLKRRKNYLNNPPLSKFQQSSRIRQFQQAPNKKRQRSLVPQAFFQECKSIFFNPKPSGLLGTINTCQYHYPKEIQEQITADNTGNIQYHQQLFCFYRQHNIYFWQYDDEKFTRPIKFLKQTYSQPITSVSFKIVTHQDFSFKNIILVAIAFGPMVKFYRLSNFEKQNQNCSPFLENMMINLYSPQIVTSITIIYQQNTEVDPQRNTLIIVLGDENANLVLFDFTSKRKYLVDSIKQKLKRKIQKQSYSQITQVLPYKQFIFCLVKRYYQPNTTWKFLQRLIRSPHAHVELQQRIEVYKIQLSTAFNSFYKGPTYSNSKVLGIKKYSELSTEQLVKKITSSFSKYFQHSSMEDAKQQIGYIQSLSLNRDSVEIMFKSSQSILVDHDLSFVQGPTLSFRKPSNFDLICRRNPDDENQIAQRQVLIKSLGSNLMLFEGFIASSSRQIDYITPFKLNQSNISVRMIRKHVKVRKEDLAVQKDQYFIFTLKGMIHVELVSLKLIILLYCIGMNEQFPLRKYIPKQKKFSQKIDDLIQIYGEIEILVAAIQLLMKAKILDQFSINLRIDLFQLAVKSVSVSTEQSLTYKEAIKLYDQNNANYIKNILFTFSKPICQQIWKIIFKLQKIKVPIPNSNEWQLSSIQTICMAYQVLISQIFRGIKNWSTKNFCFRRDQVYRIISIAKILSEIIQSYIIREAQITARKGYELQKKTANFSNYLPTEETQTLKIQFCILSKKTIEKLILLLKVYDYVCQMQFHEVVIPKFADLLFNMNQDHRIEFAITIIKTLGINNEALIGNLSLNAPELPIQQVRKFYLWQKMHSYVPQKFDDQNNRTFDSSFEGEVDEVAQILNPIFYKQIEAFYLTKFPISSNSYEKQKLEAIHFANGVLVLLKAYLKKISDLRSQEIQLIKAIQVYKKASQNYFGILQIPGFEKKTSQILKQIQFCTMRCDDIIQKLFEAYSRKLLSKQMIHSIIDAIRGILSIEVRKILYKNLEKFQLSDLVNNVSRRELFSSIRGKPFLSTPHNFVAQQISLQSARSFI